MNAKMTDVKVVTKITGNLLEITFRESVPKGEKFNPEKHEVFSRMTFDSTELNNAVRDYAVMHGIKQKLVDNLAMTAEAKEITTVEQSLKSTNELWKQLTDGHWNSPTRSSKEPSIKLSDMELKFVSAVQNGLMELEAAKTMYFSLTGLQLPEIPEDDTED